MFYRGLCGCDILRGRNRLKTLHMDKSYAGMHGKLPSRLLHPLKHLQLLTLTKSGIRAIPANAFRGLRHLQVGIATRLNQLRCFPQRRLCFRLSSFRASCLVRDLN